MRKLKLIWDFKGPDAELTARHHLTHLREYVKSNGLKPLGDGIEHINGHHHICFIALHENDMPQVRDQLKPHRGQLWEH